MSVSCVLHMSVGTLRRSEEDIAFPGHCEPLDSVPGKQTRSSAMTASALTHSAISPACLFIFKPSFLYLIVSQNRLASQRPSCYSWVWTSPPGTPGVLQVTTKAVSLPARC